MFLRDLLPIYDNSSQVHLQGSHCLTCHTPIPSLAFAQIFGRALMLHQPMTEYERVNLSKICYHIIEQVDLA